MPTHLAQLIQESRPFSGNYHVRFQHLQPPISFENIVGNSWRSTLSSSSIRSWPVWVCSCVATFSKLYEIPEFGCGLGLYRKLIKSDHQSKGTTHRYGKMPRSSEAEIRVFGSVPQHFANILHNHLAVRVGFFSSSDLHGRSPPAILGLTPLASIFSHMYSPVNI